MAKTGWMAYDEVELFNDARTVALSRVLGIDPVRLSPAKVSWIQDQFEQGFGFGLGGFGTGLFGGVDSTGADNNFALITEAPWYDPGAPASTEFAGVLSMSVDGLDDSSLTANATEYLGDGGVNGRQRHGTQPLVFSGVICASTDRGAEYGRRWLDRVLKGQKAQRGVCTGANLAYFRYGEAGFAMPLPYVHRRDVAQSRGTSITRKRTSNCSSLWWVTWTMTSADSYEYGERFRVATGVGGVVTTPALSQGALTDINLPCPEYNYDPIFDPDSPALVEPPLAPDYFPPGWTNLAGQTFVRSWVRVSPIEPSEFLSVPLMGLTTTSDVRMTRVSIFGNDAQVDDTCEPLWSAVITYLPAGVTFYIDGEQKASYVDNGGAVLRRADSLVFSPDATPLDWTAFNDNDSLLIALDTFMVGSGVTPVYGPQKLTNGNFASNSLAGWTPVAQGSATWTEVDRPIEIDSGLGAEVARLTPGAGSYGVESTLTSDSFAVTPGQTLHTTIEAYFDGTPSSVGGAGSTSNLRASLIFTGGAGSTVDLESNTQSNTAGLIEINADAVVPPGATGARLVLGVTPGSSRLKNAYFGNLVVSQVTYSSTTPIRLNVDLIPKSD